jgi:predicted GNAT family acetyltransferase
MRRGGRPPSGAAREYRIRDPSGASWWKWHVVLAKHLTDMIGGTRVLAFSTPGTFSLMRAEVHNNEERSRYELLLDDRVIGIADYRHVDDQLVLPHTEIERPLRGQGYGDQLIKGALDDIRRAGRTLVPSCWAVAEYIAEHPEYSDLVARS